MDSERAEMEQKNPTVRVDIDIPFARLVNILVKLALAAMPALIVVWFVLAITMFFFGSLSGGGWM